MTTKPNTHTPGPWYINGYAYRPDNASPTGRKVYSCNFESEVCEGYTINAANVEVAHIRTPRRLGDARLIAAAPEMFEALERLLRVATVELSGKRDDVLDQARAAIARAEGGK